MQILSRYSSHKSAGFNATIGKKEDSIVHVLIYDLLHLVSIPLLSML